MKKYFVLLIIVLSLALYECGTADGSDKNPGFNNATTSEVVLLTNDTFKKMIFNYEVNKDWKYEGKKPAIIDFYADWCPPCRQLSPLVEEIAREYSGKIDVYKVNTDNEKALAQNLGITNLPTLFFIPSEGKPQYIIGALPKENLVKAINEILLIK